MKRHDSLVLGLSTARLASRLDRLEQGLSRPPSVSRITAAAPVGESLVGESSVVLVAVPAEDAEALRNLMVEYRAKKA